MWNFKYRLMIHSFLFSLLSLHNYQRKAETHLGSYSCQPKCLGLWNSGFYFRKPGFPYWSMVSTFRKLNLDMGVKSFLTDHFKLGVRHKRIGKKVGCNSIPWSYYVRSLMMTGESRTWVGDSVSRWNERKRLLFCRKAVRCSWAQLDGLVVH